MDGMIIFREHFQLNKGGRDLIDKISVLYVSLFDLMMKIDITYMQYQI